METNTLVGLLCAFVGVTDIVLARVLASKLPPSAVTMLTLGGIALLMLGAVFGLRLIKLG